MFDFYVWNKGEIIGYEYVILVFEEYYGYGMVRKYVIDDEFSDDVEVSLLISDCLDDFWFMMLVMEF